MKWFWYAVITMFIWGVIPIFEKLGLGHSQPIGALMYRCLGAMLGFVLLIIWKTQEFKTAFSQLPQGWYFLVIGGLFGAVVGNLFYYYALKEGEVSRVVPIAGSFPIISFLIGVLFFHDSLTLTKFFGLLMVIMGIVFLR